MHDDYLSDESGDDGFPSYPSRPQRGSSTNWALIIGILAGAGLIVVLLCCGAVWYAFKFGTDVLTEGVRTELEENTVIQDQIGTIDSMAIDYTKSAATEGDNVFVFRIEGDKGSGFVTVESVTNAAGVEEVTGGTLRLDSGETVSLMPEEAEPATSEDDQPADQQTEGTQQ